MLVATDFSVFSRRTLKKVLGLIAQSPAPVTLLLVNTYLIQDADPSRLVEENDRLKKFSLNQLEQEKQFVETIHSGPGLKVELASHLGSLGNVLTHLLKKDHFDLVALGENHQQAISSISSVLEQKGIPLIVAYPDEVSL